LSKHEETTTGKRDSIDLYIYFRYCTSHDPPCFLGWLQCEL